MALLQISEPGEATAPHEHRFAAGIDLGTTNSLVASVRSGVAETLPDENGRQLLPSVVRYLENGGHIVGEQAQMHASDDASILLPRSNVLWAAVSRTLNVSAIRCLMNLLPENPACR